MRSIMQLAAAMSMAQCLLEFCHSATCIRAPTHVPPAPASPLHRFRLGMLALTLQPHDPASQAPVSHLRLCLVCWCRDLTSMPRL